ncbi:MULTISPECIES: DUF2975 domain-containing protein [Alteribacter]|uniref:DUF2975 domain-containing protein n=1 Tax=Alteribacter keqinensis TaxID=2483800 RepID=A0A3M7TPF3_9BACI|nr:MULTISPECIES: DUF2975 domain-containing protein [Alteribacter]MBM7095284.1 DUF2975 domain-containing protein [Alteribacter salitolerans]RNA67026.1 DUF2975 domain-containing protein [Alteribacter keqinensis]
MKRGSIPFLKSALVIIGLILLAMCVFVLPPLANSTAAMNPEFSHLKYPVLLGLYATAIPFYIALYQAFSLLRCIDRNNAFSESGVKTLNQIKNCATVIMALYISGFVFLALQGALHPGIILIGVTILFSCFVIFVFASVLQELLRNALKIKSENDMTV